MVSFFEHFVSAFNFGLSTSKRSVLITNSTLNHQLLCLLKETGHISSFFVVNPSFIRVYYNFAVSKFKLVSFPKTTNRFYSYAQLRSASNAGRSFIVSTSHGYMPSNLALLNHLGGRVVFEFVYTT